MRRTLEADSEQECQLLAVEKLLIDVELVVATNYLLLLKNVHNKLLARILYILLIF